MHTRTHRSIYSPPSYVNTKSWRKMDIDRQHSVSLWSDGLPALSTFGTARRLNPDRFKTVSPGPALYHREREHLQSPSNRQAYIAFLSSTPKEVSSSFTIEPKTSHRFKAKIDRTYGPEIPRSTWRSVRIDPASDLQKPSSRTTRISKTAGSGRSRAKWDRIPDSDGSLTQSRTMSRSYSSLQSGISHHVHHPKEYIGYLPKDRNLSVLAAGQFIRTSGQTSRAVRIPLQERREELNAKMGPGRYSYAINQHGLSKRWIKPTFNKFIRVNSERDLLQKKAAFG